MTSGAAPRRFDVGDVANPPSICLKPGPGKSGVFCEDTKLRAIHEASMY